jgi:SAM-dependent methyltransferase
MHKIINKFLEKIGMTGKITRRELEKFIEKHQDNGLTLDIGCSHARYKNYFPNRIGLDIRPGPEVDVVGDAHNLPFENEKFDNILCTEVLEHLHSPHLAIAEMRRVLKRGGKLILTARFIYPLHNIPNDYYRFTKYGLRYLFKEWEILDLKEEVDTQKTLAVLLQRMGYQCEILKWRPFSLIFFIGAKMIDLLPRLTTKEYGHISKTTQEKNIMAAGYYLVCRKK